MPTKKKLTPYKSSTKTAPESAAVSEKTSDAKSAPKIKRSHIAIIIVVLAAIVLVYLMRGMFVVAMVNGEPITRLDVIKELEMQGGKQISESLITEALVRQKAREKGIQATKEELDKEISTLEETYKQQGQELSEVLAMRGMTREDLVKQIELKIFLDKLVGQATVSDEEVAAFIEENNEAYGGTLTPEDVKAQLTDQKVQQASSEYITNLQKEAKIQYFVQY